MRVNYCFLCASDEGVFLDVYSDPKFFDKIELCLSNKQLNKDPISSNVCYKCAFEVNQCSEFVKKYKSSHKTSNRKKKTTNCCKLCLEPGQKGKIFDLSKEKHSTNDPFKKVKEIFQYDISKSETALVCLDCRYCLDVLYDLKTIYESMSTKVRNAILKGEENVQIPKMKTQVINRKTTTNDQNSRLDCVILSDTDDSLAAGASRSQKTRHSLTSSKARECDKCHLPVINGMDMYRFHRTGLTVCKSCLVKDDLSRSFDRKRTNMKNTKQCTVFLKDVFDNDKNLYKMEKDRYGNVTYVITDEGSESEEKPFTKRQTRKSASMLQNLNTRTRKAAQKSTSSDSDVKNKKSNTSKANLKIKTDFSSEELDVTRSRRGRSTSIAVSSSENEEKLTSRSNKRKRDSEDVIILEEVSFSAKITRVSSTSSVNSVSSTKFKSPNVGKQMETGSRKKDKVVKVKIEKQSEEESETNRSTRASRRNKVGYDKSDSGDTSKEESDTGKRVTRKNKLINEKIKVEKAQEVQPESKDKKVGRRGKVLGNKLEKMDNQNNDKVDKTVRRAKKSNEDIKIIDIESENNEAEEKKVDNEEELSSSGKESGRRKKAADGSINEKKEVDKEKESTSKSNDDLIGKKASKRVRIIDEKEEVENKEEEPVKKSKYSVRMTKTVDYKEYEEVAEGVENQGDDKGQNEKESKKPEEEENVNIEVDIQDEQEKHVSKDKERTEEKESEKGDVRVISVDNQESPAKEPTIYSCKQCDLTFDCKTDEIDHAINHSKNMSLKLHRVKDNKPASVSASESDTEGNCDQEMSESKKDSTNSNVIAEEAEIIDDIDKTGVNTSDDVDIIEEKTTEEQSQEKQQCEDEEKEKTDQENEPEVEEQTKPNDNSEIFDQNIDDRVSLTKEDILTENINDDTPNQDNKVQEEEKEIVEIDDNDDEVLEVEQDTKQDANNEDISIIDIEKNGKHKLNSQNEPIVEEHTTNNDVQEVTTDEVSTKHNTDAKDSFGENDEMTESIEDLLSRNELQVIDELNDSATETSEKELEKSTEENICANEQQQESRDCLEIDCEENLDSQEKVHESGEKKGKVENCNDSSTLNGCSVPEENESTAISDCSATDKSSNADMPSLDPLADDGDTVN